MSQIKNTTGIYVGKILKDDTPEYKRYNFMFKIGEQVWNFTGFLPWKKKDGSEKKGINAMELEEGKPYKVGYTEYQSEGMQYPSKTAIAFFEVGEGEVTSKKKVTKKIEKDTLQPILDTYMQSVEEQNRSVNHFIGTVVRNKFPEMVEEIIEVYKNYGKESEKEE